MWGKLENLNCVRIHQLFSLICALIKIIEFPASPFFSSPWSSINIVVCFHLYQSSESFPKDRRAENAAVARNIICITLWFILWIYEFPLCMLIVMESALKFSVERFVACNSVSWFIRGCLEWGASSRLDSSFPNHRFPHFATSMRTISTVKKSLLCRRKASEWKC